MNFLFAFFNKNVKEELIKFPMTNLEIEEKFPNKFNETEKKILSCDKLDNISRYNSIELYFYILKESIRYNCINLFVFMYNMQKKEIIPRFINKNKEMPYYLFEKNLQPGNHILHLAALFNATDIINFCIENGMNINVKNNHGQTPLIYVCRYSSSDKAIEIIDLLIKNGANINEKDNANNNLEYHITNNSNVRIGKKIFYHCYKKNYIKNNNKRIQKDLVVNPFKNFKI